MGGLARIAAPSGIAAMQAINVVVLNRSFLGVFAGTAALGAALAVASLLSWSQPGAALRVAGALAYGVGTFGVTMVCNVPRNDALAKLTPEDVDAAAAWATYVREWTTWNDVRTVAALVATVLFTLAFAKS
jgi:uncharacterized membrane protein